MADDPHKEPVRRRPRWLGWLFRTGPQVPPQGADGPADADALVAAEERAREDPGTTVEDAGEQDQSHRQGFLSRLFARPAPREEDPAPEDEAEPVETARAPDPETDAEPADPSCHRLRTPKPGLFPIRERLHPVIKALLSLIPFIIFVAWWFWATAGDQPEFRQISSRILPSPYEVASRVEGLWFESALMRNILISLGRVLGGFAIAAAIALPLGIAMASFGRIGATFSLVATLLSYLPMPAIVPLTMAWWKTGEQQKIGFLALGTFAYLLPLVVRHINAVDHKYVLSAYSQGASSWQVVRRVLVPIAMPGIVDALRLCLGIGWTYIVLAEVIKSGEDLGGVGNLIMVFHRFGEMGEVYLTVAAIMVVGAIMDRSCAWASGWLFPYRARSADE